MDSIKKHCIIICAFLFFIAGNAYYYRNTAGNDLLPLYIGSRLIAAGQTEYLYKANPIYFNRVQAPAWQEVAKEANIDRPFFQPYLHTPLLAYSLQPICNNLSFESFKILFLALLFSALAGMIYLSAHQWTPFFLQKPWALVGLLAIISCTKPVIYSAQLVQTHALFIFATILAIYLAERRKSSMAGLALSIAAWVKITPIIMLFYWWVIRDRKSISFFLGWTALILIFGIYSMGLPIFLTYFEKVGMISQTLITAYNNQSLAAWLADLTMDTSGDLRTWRILDLPAFFKWSGYWLISIAALSVYYFCTHYPSMQDRLKPVCFSILLVVITMASNLAWSHYYLVLIVPVMIMVDFDRYSPNLILKFILAAILVLNLSSIPLISQYLPLRAQFYSGIFCLAGLIYCMALISRHNLDSKQINNI